MNGTMTSPRTRSGVRDESNARRRGKRIGLLLVAAAAVIAARFAVDYLHERRVDAWSRHTDQSGGARHVRGTLVVSVFGDGPRVADPVRHRSIYVNGPDYAGMEDNDLRGYLDGRFKFGWNQPTQVHVRIGRRDRRPRYGELELFRVVQRWGRIDLPRGAHVVDARLNLTVESGPPFPVEMYLYNVNKDWNPGEGGEHQDNVSPPREGEVWWRDVGYKQRSWGLPGTGFASDDHPEADTPMMPLAAAWYTPGAEHLEFASAELARYIDERVAAGQPLLLLLKLSDDHEDSFGTVTTVYSGNHGDNRNVGRRPHLFIEWIAAGATRRVERDVFLEHGRSYDVELTGLGGDVTLAADFHAMAETEQPTIHVRAVDEAAWTGMTLPVAVGGPDVQLRVSAAIDPVTLGQSFDAMLRDTWILTAPPEEQDVVWTFRSPSGRALDVYADYRGGYRWAVRMVPDEIGRWRYWWTQDFAEHRFTSEVGVFDVVGGDGESVETQLSVLRDRVRAAGLDDETERVEAFGLAFARLERAALRCQTPESFASESGQRVRALLGEVRSALAGRNIPDEIPLQPQRRSW